VKPLLSLSIEKPIIRITEILVLCVSGKKIIILGTNNKNKIVQDALEAYPWW
jgi:hypothetical protein